MSGVERGGPEQKGEAGMNEGRQGSRQVLEVTLGCGVAYNINILLAIFKWSRKVEEWRRRCSSSLGKSFGPKSSGTHGGRPE